jgi:regulator of sirC expression with transglutaminase-like and TPR domain
MDHGDAGSGRSELTARWCRLLAGPESALPLDEAGLLIAAHARPDLDVGAELRRLDRLADDVEDDDADAVCDLLFRRLGIAGNTRHYDDPENSYLNRVIDRALGIPISLSVLLIEVGRRRGIPLEGVGMPGHYLVRDRSHPEALIDAFGAGRRLDDAACGELFRGLVGSDTHLHPAMLAPIGTRATLARMLANLDRTFRQRGDAPGLAWVTPLRAAIPDQPVAVLIGAAGTLGEIGRYDAAADLLEDVARRDDLPEGTAAQLRSQALGWRARLN